MEQWVDFQVYPTRNWSLLSVLAAKPVGNELFDSFVVWVINGQLNGGD